MLDRSLPLVPRRPRCCFCLPMETGCFIFGVISSVMFGIILLVLFFLLDTINDLAHALVEDMAVSENSEDKTQFDLASNSALNLIIAFLGVCFLFVFAAISFTFSVFLCYGVHKRRAGFVKVYLVYGIVMTFLFMSAAMVYTCLLQDLVGGSIMLISCGLYSLFLLMVHRTYEIIRGASVRRAPLLDSKPCMQA